MTEICNGCESLNILADKKSGKYLAVCFEKDQMTLDECADNIRISDGKIVALKKDCPREVKNK